jgi:hypothetical protein
MAAYGLDRDPDVFADKELHGAKINDLSIWRLGDLAIWRFGDLTKGFVICNFGFVWCLVLGACYLEFVWCLVLVIWNFLGAWCLLFGICLVLGACYLEFDKSQRDA